MNFGLSKGHLFDGERSNQSFSPTCQEKRPSHVASLYNRCFGEYLKKPGVSMEGFQVMIHICIRKKSNVNRFLRSPSFWHRIVIEQLKSDLLDAFCHSQGKSQVEYFAQWRDAVGL